MANRWNYVYVSLAGHADTGDDRRYLEWHQLEHMPEKYQFAGILGGQRWVSTTACRRGRAIEEGDWRQVVHVTTYLMGEPIEATLDDFLGERPPTERSRAEPTAGFPSLPNHFQAPLKVLGSWAAPRINLPPQVVPYRPNRGVLLVVEEPTAEPATDYPASDHAELAKSLVGEPGVAGACVLGHDPGIRPRQIYHGGRCRITLFYLDDEPAEVGIRLASSIQQEWLRALDRPRLVAPFETMALLDVDAFGPGRD